MIALMFANVLFIFYMTTKLGVMQAPLLLPLIAFIVYAWRHTEGKFKTLSLHLPYTTALDVDISSGKMTSSPDSDIKEPLLAASSTRVSQSADRSMAKSNHPIDTSVATTAALPKNSESQKSHVAKDNSLLVFSSDFYRSPSLMQPALAEQYPYRLQNTPLFDDNGCLASLYHDEDYRKYNYPQYEPPRKSFDSMSGSPLQQYGVNARLEANSPSRESASSSKKVVTRSVSDYIKSALHMNNDKQTADI